MCVERQLERSQSSRAEALQRIVVVEGRLSTAVAGNYSAVGTQLAVEVGNPLEVPLQA